MRRFFQIICLVVCPVGAWSENPKPASIVFEIGETPPRRDPLTYATVVLEAQVDGKIYAATTDHAGKCTFSVPAGTYRVNVTYVGYEPDERSMSLAGGASYTQHVQLRPSAVAIEDVVVTASESRGPTTASYIGREAMAHLQPSSFEDLLELLPGGRASDPTFSSSNRIHLREVPVSSSDYATSSLGIAFVIDGIPRSNDAALQYQTGLTGIGDRVTLNAGIDLRTLPTDDIASVEIIRGIPRPQIYQLLESMPARVDLEAPSDVFRITDHGIEFVDMETNTIDRQKSDAFTRAMKRKGFEFPARVVAGNASTRKEYDNGCLLVDDAFRVFHLKQVRGRPFVRRPDIPAGLGIEHIFVTEFRDRRLLGLLVDKDNRLHALETDYTLHALPIGTVDPRRESLSIVGDLFYWTVEVGNAGSERLIAVNARDYTRVDEHVFEPMAGAWQRRFGYLFPFSLSFTSSTDGYVEPRLGDFSLSALWLGLALGMGCALLCRRPLGGRWWQVAGVIVFGLFLFIPLLAMNNRKQ